ncbi:hypothetical protein ACFC09_00050 [Streptomyces sp. NPDC056161]
MHVIGGEDRTGTALTGVERLPGYGDCGSSDASRRGWLISHISR